MSYTLYDTHRDLQPCPKCGKSALAQPRENYYRCLWCGFESNVSEEEMRIPHFLLLLILVAIVVILLQGA